MQQCPATAAASAVLGCIGLPSRSGRNEFPPSLEAQPRTSAKSVQAPNVNSLSLNDMLKVVTTIFQQIMTAQWDRVRKRQNNGHHKICIKIHEAKWPLDFIGDKCDCVGEGQPQL
jgi:hypothetical protein